MDYLLNINIFPIINSILQMLKEIHGGSALPPATEILEQAPKK